MDSMEADLRSVPDLSIERLSTVLSVPGLWPAVPHLILTDLNELRQRTILSYLKQFPDTPMLGIDVTSHRVITMSIEPYTVRSTEDLTAVIRNKTLPHPEPKTPRPPVFSPGVADRLLRGALSSP